MSEKLVLLTSDFFTVTSFDVLKVLNTKKPYDIFGLNMLGKKDPYQQSVVRWQKRRLYFIDIRFPEIFCNFLAMTSFDVLKELQPKYFQLAKHLG